MGCNVTKPFDDQCNDALECLHYVSGISPRADAIRTFEEVLQKPMSKELREKIYDNVVAKRGARNMVTAIKEMVASGGDDPEVELLDDLASACRAVKLLSRSPYVAGKFEQNHIQQLLESLRQQYEHDEFIPTEATKALAVLTGGGEMTKKEYRERQFRDLCTANDNDDVDFLNTAISECLEVEDAVVFAAKIVYRKAKKPTCLEQMQRNGAYKQFIAMIETYPSNPDVAMRVCFALAALCEHDDLCVDVGKHRGSEQAVRCLYDYPDHPHVRQQALWLLNELLKQEKNYQLLKTLNLLVSFKSMQKMAARSTDKPPLIPARVSSALMRMQEEKEEEEAELARYGGKMNAVVPI